MCLLTGDVELLLSLSLLPPLYVAVCLVMSDVQLGLSGNLEVLLLEEVLSPKEHENGKKQIKEMFIYRFSSKSIIQRHCAPRAPNSTIYPLP